MLRSGKFLKQFIILSIILLLVACRNEEARPARQNGETAPSTSGPESPLSASVPATNNNEANETAAETEPTASPIPTKTATPAPPTATPLPPKEVVVCMAGEPVSLYLYGDDSLAATAVRHALYENLYTSLGYDYQPQALLKLPGLRDDDAHLRPVNVREGDLVVNSAGKVVRLLPGTQIVNADGEFVIYEPPASGASPVQMQQMVVEFEFQPMVWSDGTAVTAEDSVFSFHMASDPATPADKTKIESTADYEAVDDLTVRWTGLPGFLDPTYFTNVWPPLPQHQLEGMTAEELLTAPETSRSPLSSGPFVLTEWLPGDRLTLNRNPYYYRQDAGLPIIDRLIFKTSLISDSAHEMIPSGDCDVVLPGLVGVDHIPALLAGEQDGLFAPNFTPDVNFEHMDFGVNSWNYGDDVVGGRPDWFDFVSVRQAIAQCLNRQRMSDELLYGRAQVMDAYIPKEHPLFPDDATLWPYDLAAANTLLDEFGLEDTNGDGWREWVERDLAQNIVTTTTFSITLGASSEGELRLRLNELIQEDLAACGIQVNLYDVPAESWYDDGPFSPLFGRRFDLATFAWRMDIPPACGLYLSTNITGPEELGFGGWGNVNATGWGSEEYDLACQAALNALPGTAEYETNHQEAVRLFTDRLPAIPLFQYVKTAVTAPTVLNFKPNSTQPSELWNVFEWDVEE
jgi:peptide/nickel transport system substrate-binding protein